MLLFINLIIVMYESLKLFQLWSAGQTEHAHRGIWNLFTGFKSISGVLLWKDRCIYTEKKCISQNVKLIFFLRGCSLCGRDPVLLKTIKISLPWVCVFVNHHKQKSYGLTHIPVSSGRARGSGPGGSGPPGRLAKRESVAIWHWRGKTARTDLNTF